MSRISTVDLFCGAGGLTHGFEQAGLSVKAGYDIDPACQFPYEYNNKAKFILQSIENIKGSDILQQFEEDNIKILVGCTPCQPFSTYSRRYKQKSHKKWQLLNDFARLVTECNPEIISMENVTQLTSYQIFDDFQNQLKSLNYYISLFQVNCVDYGVPQTRKRLVFFASKFNYINLILPTHNPSNFETVRTTISHLEPLIAGQSSTQDPLHRCSKLSDLNLRRIRASKPGGTWRDWPDNLIAKCHLKETGKTYPGVYGRMEWDIPSPTITTQCFGFGNGRFGHPEQDRAISLREAALLQSFPENYHFFAPNQPVSISIIGRLIGNAVPVRLGKIVAQSILKHINKYCN